MRNVYIFDAKRYISAKKLFFIHLNEKKKKKNEYNEIPLRKIFKQIFHSNIEIPMKLFPSSLSPGHRS